MKHLLAIALLYSLGLTLYSQRTFDVTVADSTYNMKQYWFVLYTKGDSAALDSATSAATLKAHLEHQDIGQERPHRYGRSVRRQGRLAWTAAL